MKHVGVREFRDHATQYLAGDDVLAIERHGEPIGFYIPAGKSIPTGKGQRPDFHDAIKRLEQTIRKITEETGLSEDDLARLFDLHEPLEKVLEEIPSLHASRR